jgi:tight adherence protein B
MAALGSLLIVGVPMVALLAGVLGGAVPVGMRRKRDRRAADDRRAAWPEAVELLAGTVRSGETLAGAVAVVAERGPIALRADFERVAGDQCASGDLRGALERLRDALADPIADRVVATLILIHRVGGRESARVLHTLANFLRADLALRREVAARQSWTTVAARVAVAAPWIVVLLVSARAEGRDAYSTPAGAAVLLVGAAVTFIGYRVMVVTGRIPEPPRTATLGAAA